MALFKKVISGYIFYNLCACGIGDEGCNYLIRGQWTLMERLVLSKINSRRNSNNITIDGLRILGTFYELKYMVIHIRISLHITVFDGFDSDDNNSKSYAYFIRQSDFVFDCLPDSEMD